MTCHTCGQLVPKNTPARVGDIVRLKKSRHPSRLAVVARTGFHLTLAPIGPRSPLEFNQTDVWPGWLESEVDVVHGYVIINHPEGVSTVQTEF